MIDLTKSIRCVNNVYILKCENCSNEIKCKKYYALYHSGLCRSCVMKKEPFKHIFNRLVNSSIRENKEGTLTYEEFLKFTDMHECHYCNAQIQWNPYCYKNNKYTTGSHYLDRKDNNLGYSVSNCVACCTKCNLAKGNRYSYAEWFGMTEYFRRKK